MNTNEATNLRDRVTNEILPAVRQPAQYIGGEVNQLVQPSDWQKASVRVAIAFPDTYTIGTSHLGCQILYWLCNHTEGVCAERVYCPWIDAEAVMRERQVPLWTWDTRQPVRDADILGVSLQYELSFTSLLNLLDLSEIPIWSRDRTDDDPLILVGGPQADNPEPVAEFVDLVVVGDGEPAMAELLGAVKEYKRDGVPRRQMIELLAKRYPWVYAPNLYEATYDVAGIYTGLQPLVDGLPTRIERSHSTDFENDPFPVRPIVPWVEAVHDRIAVEIMRGCPNLCKFCHAGSTKRPVKMRSVEKILDIAEESYWATGYDELGLLSLSTADYPKLGELAKRANEQFASRKVNISVPSLRVDKMLSEIPWMASEVRKGGLTIAAEAARDEMRAAINKKITDGDLLAGVRAAYEAGWNRVKLYFMAGFPGETDDDITGIFDLAYAVSQERRKTGNPPAAVTAAVSWLVPKPFTPMQWMAQPRVEYFREVRKKLYETKDKKRSAVRIAMHGPEQSVLEAVFARGDRRLAPVIYEAWKNGARLDGWRECFRQERWDDAFMTVGIDPDHYAHRERSFDERLPWDHIGQHLSCEFLQKAYDGMYETLGVAKPTAGIVGDRPG